jgi:TetR/AcrR family transcriptional regulator
MGAGTELFAERGFKGATAELLARRAGVNKAMINYHFRNKRGLHEAILLATFGALADRLERIRDSARPAPEQLEAFVSAFAEGAAARPQFPAMLLREVLAGGALMTDAVLAHLLRVFGVVQSIVGHGVADGSFRPVDPLLTHLSLVGSLAFFFATEGFRRRVLARSKKTLAPPRAEDYVRHIQDLMTRGLAAGAARRKTRR